ncbi:MAG: toll/interleukin-1 receptor domain-containing protein [Hyphomonadaceae bacterium]
MADVFISYKREERDSARWLAEALHEHGFHVWWDADILPGEQYRAVTLEILQSCRAAIVIWSPKSIVSSWVLDEAQRALERGVLIPVHLEPISAYPLGFGQVHAHDLTSWDGSPGHVALQPVLASVERLAGRRADTRTAQERPQVETEVAFWRGIQDSRNPADFNAYLERYPDGLFVDLARQRAEGAAKAPAPRRKRKAPEIAPQTVQQTVSRPATAQPLLGAASPRASAPFSLGELGFIAMMTLAAAFAAWPLANSALGLDRLVYPQDYAMLTSLTTPQNIFILTPLLTGLAWGYDRLMSWWAEKGRSPLFVQFGVLVLLLVFFLASLGMRGHDGRETHLAGWLIAVWAAASYARPAVAWLRPRIDAARRAKSGGDGGGA